MDVLIIGAGTIGSTVAYTLSVSRPAVNVTLVDVKEDIAAGHAIDLRHANRHASHAIGRASFEMLPGTITSEPPDPALVSDADCIVITASAPRPEGGADRGGRLTFLERNTEIIGDVAEWLGDGPPTPVVVVSNPVDRLTHRLWRETGWPRNWFLGYSLSERARLVDELQRITGAPPAEIDCPILGEHGEHIVPIFSRATVGGDSLDLTAQQRREVTEYVRNVAYDVLDLRGSADSSRWVTGRGVAVLVERLCDGGSDEPVCLSTPLDGEYGMTDVSISVPVQVGTSGIEAIREWNLSDRESEQFETACRAVKETL